MKAPDTKMFDYTLFASIFACLARAISTSQVLILPLNGLQRLCIYTIVCAHALIPYEHYVYQALIQDKRAASDAVREGAPALVQYGCQKIRKTTQLEVDYKRRDPF